jgi:hypothetical protein
VLHGLAVPLGARRRSKEALNKLLKNQGGPIVFDETENKQLANQLGLQVGNISTLLNSQADPSDWISLLRRVGPVVVSVKPTERLLHAVVVRSCMKSGLSFQYDIGYNDPWTGREGVKQASQFNDWVQWNTSAFYRQAASSVRARYSE